MFHKPALKAHLRAQVAAPDLVAFRSEDGRTVLEGRLLPLIVPFLDGRHTPAEIADALAGQVTIVDVHYGLTLLDDEELLTEGAAVNPDAAFQHTLGSPSPAFDQRIEATSVEVMALGATNAEPLTAALEAQGLRVAERGEALVVMTDDYLHPRLAEIDRSASGRPWMLTKPVGAVVWIGPIFRLGETPCWSCLALRLRENQPTSERLKYGAAEEAAGPIGVPTPSTATSRALATQAIALQVWHWLGAGRHPQLEGQLLTLDVRTLESREHHVVRQPFCCHCGRPPEPQLPAAPNLQPVAHTQAVDGGYRSLAAEQTYRRMAHHISPISGVVGWLRDHGDSADTVQVYVADHVFRSPDEREAVRSGQRRRSAGKGLSTAQARASALCEALERYSGVFRGDEPRITARYGELEGALHPDDLQGFSTSQIEQRATGEASQEARSWVPMPFDEDRPVDWSAAWSLTEERFKHVPTAWCYFHAPLPDDHRFCRGDSNGNAAGNCLEEAILQGFLELVERDAVGIWWHNQLRRPGVDLDSFELPRLDALVRTVRGLGRTLHVLDLSHDFALGGTSKDPGIYTFAAISWSTRDRGQPLFGFGAHFDAGIAVARAVTEMCQFLPGLVAGRERKILSGTLVDDAFLQPSGRTRGRRDFPGSEPRDLRQEVEWCVELARRRQLETLIVEQTRADIGLSVVKVIVPGLRYFWPRYAPGRLYDVPVTLGWLSRAKREIQLNPIHLLI